MEIHRLQMNNEMRIDYHILLYDILEKDKFNVYLFINFPGKEIRSKLISTHQSPQIIELQFENFIVLTITRKDFDSYYELKIYNSTIKNIIPYEFSQYYQNHLMGNPVFNGLYSLIKRQISIKRISQCLRKP